MAKYEDLRADEHSLPAMAGRAWVFGDRVSCEQILAEEHFSRGPAAAAAFVLAALDPGFASRVARGDFIVAGTEFAADATHRAVPAAVRSLGVAAVVARSFGRFFQRQALAVGLPALTVEETGAIKAGDRLRVDIEAQIVANLSSGDRYVIRNLDEATLVVLRLKNRAPSP